jgi:glucose-1-phosphate adenylyltransferase
MRRGEVLALVQAGGQGSRMDVLTRERAKPVLPYGGTHRLIDFVLSSLANSGLVDIWVSVEYQVASIDDYLSGGRPWSLDRNRGGFRRMVPQSGSGPATEDEFAHGNADLLLRMSRDLMHFGAETLVVASADHVFAADLAPVIERHVDSGADATVLTSEVTKREASENVVVLTGRGAGPSTWATGVEVKVSRPSSGVVANEIFVYRTEALLEALFELRRELSAGAGSDADDGDGSADSGLGDFGEHLLPRLISGGTVRTEPLPGYWRDLGRPGAYLEGHRDLIGGKVDVFDHPGYPVISHWDDRTSARLRTGCHVEDSLVSPGADVAGEVVRSVIGPGVVVERGARVEDSVLFADCRVERGARVSTTVADDRSLFARDSVVGELPSSRVVRDEEVTLVGRDSVVGRGRHVHAGARLEPGTTA